jgi:hypothetical protein
MGSSAYGDADLKEFPLTPDGRIATILEHVGMAAARG